MNIIRIARLATVAVLLASAAAYAQLPTDNNVWKMRCAALASAEQAIDSGAVPAALVAATRGVPAAQFITFAFDRSSSGEHNVSCALFYLAAIADRAGNGARPDSSAAHDAVVLAGAELKAAHGQSVSFTEFLKQTTVKAGEIFAPSLTSAQLTAVIDAASTMPLSLRPLPPSESAQLSQPISTRRNR